MEKYRRKKQNRLPPFVPLTWEMLNSAAYKALPFSASKALPYFLGKVKLSYNNPQRLNSNFEFSYSEAQNHGFASGTHNRVIVELIDKGFIDPICKGGKRSFGYSSSLFSLSDRWKTYGTDNFKIISWRDIMPEFRKRKPTPKIDTDNIKNGVEQVKSDPIHLQN